MSNKMLRKMCFFIGDDKALSMRIQKILFDMGYSWSLNGRTLQHLESPYLYAWSDGDICYSGSSDPEWEEINIGWMRTPKEETVELNGKKYLKSELEEALKHIKPMED